LGTLYYGLLAGQIFYLYQPIADIEFIFQSLATGRLATFSLPFVDCELPADPDQTIAEDGSVQPSCKHSCACHMSFSCF